MDKSEWKRRGAALVGVLMFTASIRAQNGFVLPWVEDPPSKLPVVKSVPPVKVPVAPVASSPPVKNVIRPVAGVQEGERDAGAIQLSPPAPERLFRFESEERLRQRIRDEVKNIKVEFPPAGEAAPVFEQAPRMWPGLGITVEPSAVCHKRLWFEQKNSERYGWNFGVMQPLISASVFYGDLALLPVYWATDPFRCYDCSAGKCLPGDAVPLLWHPLFGK